jgi:hypothetical protein
MRLHAGLATAPVPAPRSPPAHWSSSLSPLPPPSRGSSSCSRLECTAGPRPRCGLAAPPAPRLPAGGEPLRPARGGEPGLPSLASSSLSSSAQLPAPLPRLPPRCSERRAARRAFFLDARPAASAAAAAAGPPGGSLRPSRSGLGPSTLRRRKGGWGWASSGWCECVGSSRMTGQRKPCPWAAKDQAPADAPPCPSLLRIRRPAPPSCGYAALPLPPADTPPCPSLLPNPRSQDPRRREHKRVRRAAAACALGAARRGRLRQCHEAAWVGGWCLGCSPSLPRAWACAQQANPGCRGSHFQGAPTSAPGRSPWRQSRRRPQPRPQSPPWRGV